MTILAHTRNLHHRCPKVLLRGLQRPKVRRLRRLVRLLAQARSEVARLDEAERTTPHSASVHTTSRSAGMNNHSADMNNHNADMSNHSAEMINRNAGTISRSAGMMNDRGRRRARMAGAA